MRILCTVLILASWLGRAAAQDPSGSLSGEVLHGEYSAARAMELLYGDFAADSMSAAWTPRHGVELNPQWPDTIRVRVLKEDSYVDAGIPRHVLVTWARPDEEGAGQYSCHTCGVLLGVAVFRKFAGGWKVESSNLEMARAGAWGRPPQIWLQRLGDHVWGIAAVMTGMQMGQMEQSLWIYGPASGGFSEWYKTQLVDDNEFGEFPQDDWCEARAGGTDVMCVWRQIDYSMEAEQGKPIYDLVRTRRKPTGCKRDVLRFDGRQFVKQPQQLAVKR